MERLTERTVEGQAIPRMDLRNNGHQKCMERLAEYEDLEEQGKLLKLPCAVGDTYYRIENDGANPPYITEWEANTIEFCVNARNSIGRTVFLTREEAEAALKEL